MPLLLPVVSVFWGNLSYGDKRVSLGVSKDFVGAFYYGNHRITTGVPPHWGCRLFLCI